MFSYFISVVFEHNKCLDCGATGDYRLMSSHCHMEHIDVHPNSLVPYNNCDKCCPCCAGCCPTWCPCNGVKYHFDCCEGNPKSKGCRKECKKCKKLWGTETKDCYEKPEGKKDLEKRHNLAKNNRMFKSSFA